MGWVDSPKFFCDFLETLTNVANYMVNTDLPVPDYGDISNLPSMETDPHHTRRSLTHIDCYMDNKISAVQGGTEQQHRVFNSTVRDLKWTFPSLPGGIQILGECQEDTGGGGGLELRKGGPQVDLRHGGRDSHPPRVQVT